MKFGIEVLRSREGAEPEVLRREIADEISPKRALAKAQQLLEIWRHRGADAVRVLNPKGEEIYRFTA